MTDDVSCDGSHAAEEGEYEVVLSSDALFVYLNMPFSADADAVDAKLGLLARFPYLGRHYDPLYKAARPPFDLFVTLAGHYSIYYEVSEDTRTVSVAYLEDQRRNPANRFTGIQQFYG